MFGDAFCNLCSCDVNITHGGRDDIHKHCTTQKHLNAASAAKFQPSVLSFAGADRSAIILPTRNVAGDNSMTSCFVSFQRSQKSESAVNCTVVSVCNLFIAHLVVDNAEYCMFYRHEIRSSICCVCCSL